jgi:hypothetical protein
MAEVYLALWEATPEEETGECRRLAEVVRKICGRLRLSRYAARARAQRIQGMYDWLIGKPAQARRGWQKSMELAERLHMPFELGQAHYEIGRHLSIDDPQRAEHLTRARDIFAQIGAAYDRSLAEAALAAQSLPNFAQQ